MLDDIYNVYGTHEELEILTKAIHIWDINSINQFPNYMKLCYSELLNVYKEIEDLMTDREKSYRVQFAKEAMIKQCQAFYVEIE